MRIRSWLLPIPILSSSKGILHKQPLSISSNMNTDVLRVYKLHIRQTLQPFGFWLMPPLLSDILIIFAFMLGKEINRIRFTTYPRNRIRGRVWPHCCGKCRRPITRQSSRHDWSSHWNPLEHICKWYLLNYSLISNTTDCLYYAGKSRTTKWSRLEAFDWHGCWCHRLWL